MKRNIGISVIWGTFTLAIAFLCLILDTDSFIFKDASYGEYNYPLYGSDLFYYIIVFGFGGLIVFLVQTLNYIYKAIIIIFISCVFIGIILGVHQAEFLTSAEIQERGKYYWDKGAFRLFDEITIP